MSRSMKHACTLAFASSFVLLAVFPSISAGIERPNILWIVADDLSPDLSCYGEEAVKTPHIDQLAMEGIRFNLAFATSPTCSPSRTAIITGMYQTTIGGHHHRTRTKPELKNGIVPITEPFRQAGYFVCNMGRPEGGGKAKTDYNFTWDAKLYDGDDWSQRDEGQPFFAQLQIKEPHRNFVQNQDSSRPRRINLPPTYPDHPLVRSDWSDYLASVEVLDRKVGEVLQRLDDEGLSNDTIVVFFGDHGRPQVWAKQWLYDAGIRVPLIIRWPNQIQANSEDDRLVSLIDLAPSTLAMAAIDVPETMQGQNLFDDSIPEREFVFAARDRCGDAPDRIRSVRTDRFKYIRNDEPNRSYTQVSSYKKLQYPVMTLLHVLHARGELDPIQARFFSGVRPAEELYDVVADPFETHNLADSAEHAQVLDDLRVRLDRWIDETDDQGRIPEGDQAFHEALKAEKQVWYEGVMRRRGLDPDLTDEEYLEWWLGKIP